MVQSLARVLEAAASSAFGQKDHQRGGKDALVYQQPKLPLPVYDGESRDLDSFLAEFEDAMLTLGRDRPVPDHDRLGYLELCLKGRWNELLKFVKKEFREKGRPADSREVFNAVIG